MTGLDLKKDMDPILIHYPSSVIEAMGAWSSTHRGKSGLTKLVHKSTISMSKVESRVLAFIKKHVPHTGPFLAQLGPHGSRPRVVEYLDHRLLDVSSVALVASWWLPDKSSMRPPKTDTHCADRDIMESIAELRWYRNHVFCAPFRVASENKAKK
ncbi:hypothetical protein GGF32_006984 [Allomyces javanicus]|nr:hypothetical protein GGF32_006984 [Allomyces javanicus]